MRFTEEEFVEELENLRDTSLEIDGIMDAYDLTDGKMIDWQQRHLDLFLLFCDDVDDGSFERIVRYTWIKGSPDEGLKRLIYKDILAYQKSKREE